MRRYAMTLLATAGVPEFSVSRMEIERKRPTHTVDTLREFIAGGTPPEDLFFITGLDALLSIVQMPPGIPVASVGVNGALNAALLAVRGGRKKVVMADLSEAVEKATIGLQKKSKVIREEERKVIAFHETGHALVSKFTEGADQVHKITIVPRGTSALGYTFHIPEDDKHIVTEKQLLAEVDVLLGGRAAEQVAFNMVSTGAANDLMRATDIARSIIVDYGMSAKFKNVALSKRGSGYLGNDPQLVREYAETTQQYIDEEIAKIIDGRYEAVVKLLTAKKDLLDYIAKRLLEKETIESEEFETIIAAENSLDTLQLDKHGAAETEPENNSGISADLKGSNMRL